jgi:3-dehydroquinate synthase
MVKRNFMPTFEVKTTQRIYPSVVERGILKQVGRFIPRNTGKLFVITTDEVWRLHGKSLEAPIAQYDHSVLKLAEGEENKRFSWVETLAEKMMEQGADKTSLVIGFGGGIVADVSGFLASIFMRGIPTIQIPTTLLAQVDAAVGGKTGVNLTSGKNLIGTYHHPIAVLTDPDVLCTLSAREYRAGVFEIIKCGIIRDEPLFAFLESAVEKIMAKDADSVDRIIADAVRIKAEVVSADERESDLRRILNFGHTVGHAIEAETEYVYFIHGEAVAWGMLAATRLAELLDVLPQTDARRIKTLICRYGPLPPASDLDPDHLVSRLSSDKKTVGGKVHFVLPTRIGEVKIFAGQDMAVVREAIVDALQARD